MDGLELSSIVKKSLPDIRIIIMSGYKEFEYAKKAINIGVSEFLSKPVTSAELLRVLNTVKEDILSKRTVHSSVDFEKDMKKNSFLEELLSGTLSSHELIQSATALGLDIISPLYAVILCKFRRGTLSPEEMEVADRATACVKKILSADCRLLCFDRGIDGLFILAMADEEAELSGMAVYVEKLFANALEESPFLKYYGGIGLSVKRLSHINSSYQNASMLFSTRFSNPKNMFVSNSRDDTVLSRDDIDPFFLSWKPFEIFYQNGNADNIETFLGDMAAAVAPLRDEEKENILRHIGTNAYYSAKLFFSDTLPLEKSDYSFLHFPGDAECSGLQPFLAYIGKILEHIIVARQTNITGKYSAQVVRAINYMRSHPCESTISLNTVSTYVNMSGPYFSSLFAKETGSNFIEYLTSLRMEKAKEILLSTDKKPSEIALMVGYQDSQYFSHLFRKTSGCTPKEYREGEMR